MHNLIGKKIRCDYGFYGQTEPLFGIVVGIENDYCEPVVVFKFDGYSRVSRTVLSGLGKDFFVIGNSTEEFE